MDHLSSLFDRALDAVVGMDASGNVTAWNTAAEAIFGWGKDEAMGQSMGALIVPRQYRAAHNVGLAHYNATGEGPVLEKRLRLSAIDRTGTEFPVELSIFPMKGESGSSFFAFIRSLASDEQNRREQERRVQEAEILLSVAQKLLEDISADDFTRFCLKRICEVGGFSAGHVLFARGSGSTGVLVSSGLWHISDERHAAAITGSAGMIFKRGEGLPGRAWAEQDLLVVDELSSAPFFMQTQSFAAAGRVRGLAFPIAREDRTEAVLEFFGGAEARIDEQILVLVRTVGNQIGIAMQRKEASELREILRREVAHRVGNSLAVLSAIFRSCAAKARSVDELVHAYSGRLHAVGRAHRLSVEDQRQSTSLRRLLGDVIALLPDQGAVEVISSDLVIEGAAVLPLSLVLSELVTNFLKHGGADDGSHLQIRVEALASDSLRLEWIERRKHSVLPFGPEGYGSFLIRTMIESRLGGTMSRSIVGNEFKYEATIPSGQILSNGR